MRPVDAPPATTYRLRNTYPLWRPVLITTPIAVVVCVLIATGAGAGRDTVVAIIVVIWVAYLTSRVALSRAAMETQGAVLRVRRVLRWHELPGPQVTRLTQALSPRGPNFRIGTTENPSGVLAPCALVHGGQSILFTWLLTFAPSAELDPGATRTLRLLEQRGLVTPRLSRSPEPDPTEPDPTEPDSTPEDGNQGVGA